MSAGIGPGSNEIDTETMVRTTSETSGQDELNKPGRNGQP